MVVILLTKHHPEFEALRGSKVELKLCKEPFCKEFYRKMSNSMKVCEGAIIPVRKLLEELQLKVAELLTFFGETDSSSRYRSVEELFKNIRIFHTVYTTEERLQAEKQRKAPLKKAK